MKMNAYPQVSRDAANDDEYEMVPSPLVGVVGFIISVD